eukprot:TRINITY_DN25693_c0_g1_i1.p1 TRINITY_DN25693_c0_g1~~TRINITY_DN25693_c0_g1_i1.p1  ORF type:complete len:109 (+),score=24.01 TRINITY_DN25693_c0_g1_i1:144-470(+)
MFDVANVADIVADASQHIFKRSDHASLLSPDEDQLDDDDDDDTENNGNTSCSINGDIAIERQPLNAQNNNTERIKKNLKKKERKKVKNKNLNSRASTLEFDLNEDDAL